MKSSHKKNNNDKGNCSTHALKIPFTYNTHCEYSLIDIINEDYYNDIHTNGQCTGERGNVYVSILLSQFVPASFFPNVSTNLFSRSEFPQLSCK